MPSDAMTDGVNMDNPQYMSLGELKSWLNTMPNELSDGDIKGALINLCEQIEMVRYYQDRQNESPDA
jgi:hypothetical protein